MGKVWKCTKCNTEMFFKYGRDEKVVLKLCPVCVDHEMEVKG